MNSNDSLELLNWALSKGLTIKQDIFFDLGPKTTISVGDYHGSFIVDKIGAKDIWTYYLAPMLLGIRRQVSNATVK